MSLFSFSAKEQKGDEENARKKVAAVTKDAFCNFLGEDKFDSPRAGAFAHAALLHHCVAAAAAVSVQLFSSVEKKDS